MSDFLSPAINERLKEKRMEFDKRIDEMLKPVNDMAVFCHVHNNPYKGPNLKDEIRQLFLDTIEKAKPEEKPGINVYKEGTADEFYSCAECGGYDECDCSGFNEGVDEFYDRLKKEIGE